MTLSRLGMVVGAVAAVGWGVNEMMKHFREAPPNVTKLTDSLIDFARKGKVSGEAAKVFGADLEEFGEAVARVAHPSNMDRVTDFMHKAAHFGLVNNPELQEAADKIKALDESLASLVTSGHADTAASAFKGLGAAADADHARDLHLLLESPGWLAELATLVAAEARRGATGPG
jgi:polyhydroxyalkanoate synthesis regulator phasin